MGEPWSLVYSLGDSFLQYRPGGYHPIALGDVLDDGRYRVFHKWGMGIDATIWYARDMKLDRCVTIKIKTAERTKYSQELKILLDLQKSSNGHDRDHVIQLLNHFYIEGPNGCHQALVFELIGPGVDQTIEGAASIPEELDFEEIVEAAVPLLRGLDFVHKAGHAHGALNLGSLVYKAEHLSQLSEQELLRLLGPTESRTRGDRLRVDPGSGVPERIVKAACWDHWWEFFPDVYEGRLLRLFNFEGICGTGASLGLENHGYDMHTTTNMAECVDFRADLWAAGVFVSSLSH
ncbi:hypothetical protein MMC10_008528 [Thelotrema lepadinum]|nr:hypothetical protein [Thelotrema lepadinum]